jgi:hypothetical protein
MKKTLALAVSVACLAAPGSALAVETATAPFVGSHLVRHYKTSDGVRLRSADCSPQNAFDVVRGRIFAPAWKCIEVDVLSRVFWVHTRVVAGPLGVSRPIQYRCDSKDSRYRCP